MTRRRKVQVSTDETILAKDLDKGHRILGRDGRPRWTVDNKTVERVGWPRGNGRVVITTAERPDMPLFYRERSQVEVREP